MKHLLVFLLLIVIFSCSTHEKSKSESDQEEGILIHSYDGVDKYAIHLEKNDFENIDSLNEQILVSEIKLINSDLDTININHVATLNIWASKFYSFDQKDFLVVERFEPLETSKFIVFELRTDTVEKLGESFCCYANDFDNDGKIELGGKSLSEAYCVSCDSSYYDPYLFYELSDNMVFDSLFSENINRSIYDVFLGYNQIDTILHINKDILPN
ncbi:MAG: hypothetical protein AAGA64_17770 [Bacteroidota bacterium]